MGASQDAALKVELVGEMALTQQPESLENKILMVPTSPSGHKFVTDTSGQYHLLIEREQISFNGQECNKVGTSY